MNKSQLFAAAAAATVLAGCATDPTTGAMSFDGGSGLRALTSPLDQICNTPSFHCIDVKISTTSSGPTINAINDLAVIGPNHVIIWKIVTTGYSFPDGGIDFKVSSAARPHDEFLCKAVSQRGLYVCINRNTKKETYDYKVTVKDAMGTPLPPLDPKIVNQ
jgi:hypothetical protein